MPTCKLPGPIAVIDVETTGLFPHRHDRVVEVAAILIDGDGEIVREFVSLVNPERDIGPSSIHGLTAEDVLQAPRFGDIASLLVDTLDGALAVAGHNVRFDREFIQSEFSRIGSTELECYTLCTMQLAGGGRLAECCGEYGITLSGESHCALHDAHATARLLPTLLPSHPGVLEELRNKTPIKWPAIPATGSQALTRDESRRRKQEPPTFLQRLVGRMPSSDQRVNMDGAAMAYAALLDRVLEDRYINDSEADALVAMATKWGLTVEQITAAHRDYLNRLAVAAVADGVVTESELKDLRLVGRLLGQQDQNLEVTLREAAANVAGVLKASSPTPSAANDLTGKTVCFTGEFQCRRAGQLIPRELAEELAAKAGMIVTGSVTKKLDLLVLADPQSQSGKAKKARQYGIRILHEPVFWKAIGVDVE